jgi:hypothetical protein
MLGGQPIIILRENVERNRGLEAQRSNIAAAKAIAWTRCWYRGPGT